jgi:ABC-type Fe3+-siderophore transport system permease subunit
MALSRTWLIVIADVFGLSVLAALVGIAFWLLHDESISTFGAIVYLIMAGCCFYVWHPDAEEKRKISSPLEWLRLAVASIAIGAISFGIDVLGGVIFHPELSPIVAGTRAGSPFGFGLTLICCPGLTMIAIAGFARSLLQPENDTDKKIG